MPTTWDARGLSQDELMIKDECILVDENDRIVGHASKKDTHIFSQEFPRGKLHRAFSVFLFNSEGKLLIQQRALSKITFPGVWTNTCCSHPLYGSEPSEVDNNDKGSVVSTSGAVSAAIRKLDHELGIATDSIPAKKFKFLTRLHYWAVDAVTHGTKAPWGEHEMDYIFFVQANVKVVPNAEEVAGFKYVSMDELFDMMKSPGLLWSPWFKIIAHGFLVHWWKDLKKTLTTNEFVNLKTIHRFDPSSEHMGGAGGAGAWLGQAISPYSPKASTVGNTSLKQGAYGKVIIHSHSKLEQILRIDEIFAALWFKFGAGMENKVKITDENVRFCDDMLGKVSRSFASVIRQLPTGLCIDILIFYLALRALDTIEDDMEAFKGRENLKIHHLNTFYQTGLVTDGWSMDGVGAGDEKVLLQQYYRVVAVFKSLPANSQEVIADITKRMGQGMASFVQIDLGQGTITVKDYNLYCHYVAGLVGEGLSRLFTCRGYESQEVAQVSTTLANTMGLFLQKTNIIRDYLEDYVDGRAFWPQEIWKQYSHTGDLGEFAHKDNSERAVHLLNHLVTDALECVPECMDYMSLLHTEEIFRFCAIPQVMAIATLAELYNNPKVFTGVVKIRKGMAAKLILDTSSFDGLHKWFNILAREILRKVDRKSDPNAEKTIAICQKIISTTNYHAQRGIAGSYAQILATICPAIMAWSGYHLFGTSSLVNGKFELRSRPFVDLIDYIAAFFLIAAVLFYLGYQVVSRVAPTSDLKKT
jgi:farnesyl-diphosphate farnesyltransferase